MTPAAVHYGRARQLHAECQQKGGPECGQQLRQRLLSVLVAAQPWLTLLHAASAHSATCLSEAVALRFHKTAPCGIGAARGLRHVGGADGAACSPSA
jgi:hypothetical protein